MEELTNEQLVDKYRKTHDENLLQQLCEKNKPFIIKEAKRYYATAPHKTTISVEDLIQAGYLGLIKSVNTYKPISKFLSHAGFYIKTEMREELCRNGFGTYIPRNILEKITRIANIIKDIEMSEKSSEFAHMQFDDKVDLLSSKSKLNKEIIEIYFTIQNSLSNPISYDSSPNDDIKLDFDDITSTTYEGEEVISDVYYALYQGINHLPKEEGDMIKHRYGLQDYEKLSLEKLGQKYGIPRDSVKNKLISAQNKLKEFIAKEFPEIDINLL